MNICCIKFRNELTFKSLMTLLHHEMLCTGNNTLHTLFETFIQMIC